MKKLNMYLWVAICCMVFSCKKETVNTALTSSGENAFLSLGEESKWRGEFLSYNGLPPSRSVPDNIFIKNGYARIYSESVKINKHNYYGTQIRLMIPASIIIKGDSLNFEAGVKNPFDASFYSPSYGRDVKMYIKGETNQAFINTVATSDVDPEGLKRGALKIGQTLKNNLPQLQHNFHDYDTLILQTFNRGLVAYRNNAYLTGIGYESEPNIGRLTEIGIIFKGSGFINYIKMYNSVTGKLLMAENFDTDGQSTVVWY